MINADKRWIPVGIASSSLGNFLITLVLAHVATTPSEFGSFAIVFTYYTIAVTFMRPILSDALVNKDKFQRSNGKEYIFDAFLVSLLITLISVFFYASVPQFDSMFMIILCFSIPALLMHDAIRFHLLSIRLNMQIAILDMSWTLLFIIFVILLFSTNQQEAILIFSCWTIPTFLTSAIGIYLVIKNDPGIWAVSWLYASREIWLKIFKDFLLGAGAIQLIFLAAISIFDSQSISSFRLSITLLFPIILLNSSRILEIFNFGNVSASRIKFPLELGELIWKERLMKAILCLYLLFLIIFHKQIVSILISAPFNLSLTTLILSALLVVSSTVQINQLNILKKRNRYESIINLRKTMFPFLIILCLLFGLFFSFNGVLAALNLYTFALFLWLNKILVDERTDQRILIATEFSSGGGYFAAKNHSQQLSDLGIDVHFAYPGLSNSTPNEWQINDSSFQKIYTLKFPERIGNLSSDICFMRQFRKLWVSLDRPPLFSHGIRSGFLISICCLRRPNVLIHRHLNSGLSLFTKILLKLHFFFFKRTASVAPTAQGFRRIEFFPILSPILLENSSILKHDRANYNEKLRILWLSRLEYPKEPEILLHALGNLDRNSYICRIIGTGPKEFECRNFAGTNNLSIDFLPHSNVIEELRNTDVVILTSKFEGVPFVLQEALAMGVAVACSRLPGNEFLGGDAFEYANDSTQLSEILLSLMNPLSLSLRKSMVENRWKLIYPKLNSNWTSNRFTLPRRGSIK